jgi:hypothetical protein
MTRHTLSPRDVDSLAHALRTARERFREDADVLRGAAEAGDNGFMTAEAAERMAAEFDRYVERCEALEALIDSGASVVLDGECECVACGEELTPREAAASVDEHGEVLCEECASEADPSAASQIRPVD